MCAGSSTSARARSVGTSPSVTPSFFVPLPRFTTKHPRFPRAPSRGPRHRAGHRSSGASLKRLVATKDRLKGGITPAAKPDAAAADHCLGESFNLRPPRRPQDRRGRAQDRACIAHRVRATMPRRAEVRAWTRCRHLRIDSIAEAERCAFMEATLPARDVVRRTRARVFEDPDHIQTRPRSRPVIVHDEPARLRVTDTGSGRAQAAVESAPARSVPAF